MKKKIYGRTTAVIITLMAAIMVGAVGKNIVSAAESRQIFIPGSYGRFVYDDGDASNNNGHEHDLLIDASDFTVIAENISSLYGITDELQQDFQDGVNKIYNKLSGLGFTPITNSPNDINNAMQDMYDSRYSLGYSEGLRQIQSANAKIRYIYHQHIGDYNSRGGCYTIPEICNSNWDYTGQDVADESKCRNGHDISYRGDESNDFRCNYIMGYALSCGMSTNTIISAVIEFDY